MSTDRNYTLRKADRALEDIDRAIAGPAFNVDDLVHHPGQYVVNIAGQDWYHRWSNDDRRASGRRWVTDSKAQTLADNETSVVLSYRTPHNEERYGFCWHCGCVRPRPCYTDGDDVCEVCRRAIDAVVAGTSDEILADVAPSTYVQHQALMARYGDSERDGLVVDGIPFAGGHYKPGMASMKPF